MMKHRLIRFLFPRGALPVLIGAQVFVHPPRQRWTLSAARQIIRAISTRMRNPGNQIYGGQFLYSVYPDVSYPIEWNFGWLRKF